MVKTNDSFISKLLNTWKHVKVSQSAAQLFISCLWRVKQRRDVSPFSFSSFYHSWVSLPFKERYVKVRTLSLIRRGTIGQVRYINILTWLRGFQDKLLYLVLFSLYPGLCWELRDNRNLMN